MDTTALKFRRTTTGRYRAEGATVSYVITKNGKNWGLDLWTQDHSISDLVLLGERKDFMGWHDTLALAKAIAAEYEALGDDYRSCDHGYANRTTIAIANAYAKA